MNLWETRAFNVLMAVVTATGCAYLWMKYVLRTDDPFSIVNHPWEPEMLAAHIVAAPVAMLVFGMLFRSHVLKKLLSNRKPARRSGWTSLISFAAMALSGYGLQVATDPAWIDAWLWLHVSTSLVFVLGYATHLVIGWELPARILGMLGKPGLAKARGPS